MTNSAGPEFVLSGARSSTSTSSQGTYGLYWSSTAYSSAIYAYYLLLNSSGGTVGPAYGYDKYRGFSLRCLAETTQPHQLRPLACSFIQDYSKFSKQRKEAPLLSTHTIYQLLTDSTGPNLVSTSGWRNGASMYNQDTYGFYWSSTAFSPATEAYALYLNNSSTVGPAFGTRKQYGFSLRCLARRRHTHYPNYTSMTNSAGPEFVLGGYLNGTIMNDPGTRARYWSSTAYLTNTSAHFILLGNNGAVGPVNYDDKKAGFSLRCLAVIDPTRFASTLPQNVFCQERKKEANFPFTHYPNYTSMTNSAGPEFVLGGYRRNVDMVLQSSYGGCWSNTAYSGASASYRMYLDVNGSVGPAGNAIKEGGFPLRCLALLHPHHLPTTH